MTSPNRIQAWVERVPPSAAQLVLVWESLKDVPLAIWSREDIQNAPHAGTDILSAAQDHCDDSDRIGSYAAIWATSEGLGLARKSFKCEPTREDEKPDEDLLRADVRTEAATPEGQVAQMMRHSEVDRRITNAANAAAFSAMQQVIKDLRSELALEKQESRSLRQRLNAARSQNETDASEVETLARAEVWTQLGTAIQGVATQAAPAVASAIAEKVATAAVNGRARKHARTESDA